ncbi:UNVERIFIED_CONTAM: Ferroptosis suppressor protein 1 [Sesamum radiatum]|uniref:Ferroptosis suppressor protein 1 n=1 Tax=Sesamum radiatum TaxID=300843 RepID=A0AAW2KBA8_SESRA
MTLMKSQRKEYFELPWAGLRSKVEPSFAKRIVINHLEYLSKARVIASPATNITENEVLTAQGRLIAYDYLVVATGHTSTGGYTKDERLNYYQTEHEKIKAAKSILIVGGGPTGVELAGEIVVDFPDKKETILKDCLDDRGRLKVDATLRVKGHGNIFAIGDITDVPELKQGYLAQAHAMLTAKNLKKLIRGQNSKKLSTYKPASDVAIVSLGRREGIAQFMCLTVGGRLPGIMKSKDLFVGKTRNSLGLKSNVA